MAEQAALAAFMQALFEKLITASVEEFRLLRGAQGEVQSLTSTLSTIQALLEDAEEKQLKDKSVRHWLAKLKDVAYDMDELLDRHMTLVLRKKVESRRQKGWKVLVSDCFSNFCSSNVSIDYMLGYKIRAIQQKFDKIVKERDNLGLQMLCGSSQLQFVGRPQTSSIVDGENAFGRDEDREAIINVLLSIISNSKGNAPVLPIVGMGGLGKTTLAQLVYNDHRVKEHFEIKIWISAQNFDEMKLTKEALESIDSGYSSATTNMNLLQKDLVKKLKGKRFLLVLDDVWNEDPEKWYRYSKAFAAGEEGSMVIVTTQNANVARSMGGLSPYELKCLSDDDCWRLFKNYAFVEGNSSKHPNLEEIGREIVKKLKGLPLAAKTLGSLLYMKLDEEDWKCILKSEIWELPQDKNNILPALRLSYKHLPPYLKQCFAFCSVFHKDYIFGKDKLVKIWLALGFIQPQGRKRLEDIGSSYFDELVSRSFFQSHGGNYMMHDAIHDLAQSLSIGECCRLENNNVLHDVESLSMEEFTYKLGNINLKKIRHLSFSCPNSASTPFEKFYAFEKLQTLLLLQGYKSRTSGISDDLFLLVQCLRVLDLHRRDIYKLPDSIGNLIHLRYLGLSGTCIKILPESISKLYNLQTLSLEDGKLIKVPDGITKLVNLRHLEASTRLISDINSIGSLTSLQKLDEYTVRKDTGYKITELKGMKELRGHLCIKGLENVVNRKEANEANLNVKEHLNVLGLEWSDERNISQNDESRDYEILEALQPHHELKELTIKGYAGAKFPSWFGDPFFCYLQAVHISKCRQLKLLPLLELLPLLRYLNIAEVHGLTRINHKCLENGDIKRFSSLTELILEDMPDLEEWICTDDVEFLPCLNEFELVACPKLRKLPHLPTTLERLKILGAGIIALPELWGSNSLPLPSLLSLHIHHCQNLLSLQQGVLEQQLLALEELRITECQKLVSLPVEGFRNLVALKYLNIQNCPNLVLPEDDMVLLPRLVKDLRISSCSKLVSRLLTELKDLPFLEHLQITDCSDLYYFPEEALPPMLKYFGISDCNNLQFLPLRLKELSQLVTLIVSNCPQLQYLPEKGLPVELQELCITECPLLEKRCQVNGGEDWHKIAHVPRALIG